MVYHIAGKYDRSMEWLVTLSGSAHALEELSKVYDTPDLRIQKEHNEFHLRSRDFSDFVSYEEVRDHTNEILTLLNGATKLALGSHTPITIGSISKIRDDGTRHVYISVTSSVVISATCSTTVTHVDGTIEEFHPADPVITWLELSKRDAHVRRALYLIENDFETWSGLYKVYEVIQEDVGNIPKMGWCTLAELKRFKQTANSPEALGVDARHGEMIPAPSDPMSLSSAKILISKFLREWLKEKEVQYGF